MADGSFRLAVKKIAVVVEGPSDEVFWEKVLNREFSHRCRFKVIKQNGRSNVIAAASDLAESLRGAGYSAVFFVVDLDDDPCFEAVKNLFAASVQVTASEAVEQRFAHLCVARREFESWLLADAAGIRAALPNVDYVCAEITDLRSGKPQLKRLIHADRGPGASFREPAFAREMAPHFSPINAIQWSPSFAHFWGRMTAVVERLSQ